MFGPVQCNRLHLGAASANGIVKRHADDARQHSDRVATQKIVSLQTKDISHVVVADWFDFCIIGSVAWLSELALLKIATLNKADFIAGGQRADDTHINSRCWSARTFIDSTMMQLSPRATKS